jgi:hypothetical protein
MRVQVEVQRRREAMERLRDELGRSIVPPELAAAGDDADADAERDGGDGDAAAGLEADAGWAAGGGSWAGLRTPRTPRDHAAGADGDAPSPAAQRAGRARPSPPAATTAASLPWIPDWAAEAARPSGSPPPAGARNPATPDRGDGGGRPAAVPPLWVGAWIAQAAPVPGTPDGSLAAPRAGHGGVDGGGGDAGGCGGGGEGGGGGAGGSPARRDDWGWLSFRATLGSLIPEIRNHTF